MSALNDPDPLPCLTPLVRGAPSITPKMVFWQGRYISVSQLYAVDNSIIPFVLCNYDLTIKRIIKQYLSFLYQVNKCRFGLFSMNHNHLKMAGVQPNGDSSVRHTGTASEKNSSICLLLLFLCLFVTILFPNPSQEYPNWHCCLSTSVTLHPNP